MPMTTCALRLEFYLVPKELKKNCTQWGKKQRQRQQERGRISSHVLWTWIFPSPKLKKGTISSRQGNLHGIAYNSIVQHERKAVEWKLIDALCDLMSAPRLVRAIWPCQGHKLQEQQSQTEVIYEKPCSKAVACLNLLTWVYILSI